MQNQRIVEPELVAEPVEPVVSEVPEAMQLCLVFQVVKQVMAEPEVSVEQPVTPERSPSRVVLSQPKSVRMVRQLERVPAVTAEMAEMVEKEDLLEKVCQISAKAVKVEPEETAEMQKI